MLVQTEDILPRIDERAFEQSSDGLRTSMKSAQSTFQDSAESLRDILTDAMHQELKANIGCAMDQLERKPDQAAKYTQTSGLYVSRNNYLTIAGKFR